MPGTLGREDLIYQVLAEVKDDFWWGQVKKTKGAALPRPLERRPRRNKVVLVRGGYGALHFWGGGPHAARYCRGG